MPAIAEKILTSQDYLVLERQKTFERKAEFFNNEIYKMAGASGIHNLICTNLIFLLMFHLKNKDFKITQSDLRVHDPNGNYFYPDIVITKGVHEYVADNQFDTLLNPHLIIEVLTESTKDFDRREKFQAYRSIPSLQEYLLIAQDEYSIEHFYKKENEWVISETLMDLNDILEFKNLPLSLKVSEIYEGIKL